MTEVILPTTSVQGGGQQQGAERMQVTVHLQAEVLTPDQARRRANIWLAMNAGNLLIVKNPELVLGEILQWRFDVFLSLPRHDQPGLIRQNQIGQIRLDATTGEVIQSEGLIEELKANATALAVH